MALDFSKCINCGKKVLIKWKNEKVYCSDQCRLENARKKKFEKPY